MKYIAVLFLLLTIPFASAKDISPELISMYSLISAPEKYNNKLVKIYGYLHIEYEADAIYVNEIDYKHALFKNAIALNIKYDAKHKSIVKKFNLKELNNKYVSITGMFINPEFGDSLYTAELKSIVEIELHELVQLD